jgi:hypothetical protein
VGISVLAVIPLIYLRRRYSPRLLMALLVIAAGPLVNAFAAGVFSTPCARLEGRIIWLLPFWVIAAGLWLHAHRNDPPSAFAENV